MAKMTSDELNMLGFNEQGVSTIGDGNASHNIANVWESVPKPRMIAKRVARPSLHFGFGDGYNKPVPHDKQAQLAELVGKLVCVRGVYGMIDSVHNDRLGFIEGSADEWSSHIVPMNQVRVCTDAEREMARNSAEWYYLNECHSLGARLKHDTPDRGRIIEMYNECADWYKVVKAM